jgi:hypothetical protein
LAFHLVYRATIIDRALFCFQLVIYFEGLHFEQVYSSARVYHNLLRLSLLGSIAALGTVVVDYPYSLVLSAEGVGLASYKPGTLLALLDCHWLVDFPLGIVTVRPSVFHLIVRASKKLVLLAYV